MSGQNWAIKLDTKKKKVENKSVHIFQFYKYSSSF